MLSIAEDVRRMRGDMTLAEVSEMTGISISYLSDIERGRTIPSIATLQKLTGAFNHVLVIGMYPVIDPNQITE